MQVKKRKGILALLLAAQVLSFSVGLDAAAAGTITMQQPSDSFNGVVQIAPLRDFLIKGKLEGFPETVVNVKATLKDASGNIVRTVTSAVNAEGYTDSTKIDISDVGNHGSSKWTNNHTALINNPSPDLVEDKTNSANKAVVNRRGEYSVLILGGMDSQSGITESGMPLIAGEYKLEIEAIGADSSVLATTNTTINVDASNMVCGRFSPTQNDDYPHFETMKQFALDNNLKALLDSFPAYWSQDNTPFSEEVFYENLKLWRRNDLAEYLAAPVTCVVIYNISPTSASQGVEIGGIIKNNYLQDATPGHSVYFYRYDIGDVDVVYTLSNGTIARKTGTIVDFDGTHSSKDYNQIVVARAERREAGALTSENVNIPRAADKTLDTNVADGVYLKPQQTLSLIGATTPLAGVSVTYDSDREFYTVNKRITQLRYTITNPEGDTNTLTRDVAMNRQYSPTWLAGSIYEYKNDFLAENFPQEGVYRIELQGIDTDGAEVANASTAFDLTVSATGLIAPTGTAFTADQLKVGGAMLDLQMDEALSASDLRWQRYAATSGTEAAGAAINSLSGIVKADSMRLAMTPYNMAFRHLQHNCLADDLWADVFYSKSSGDSFDLHGSSIAVGYDRKLGNKAVAGVMIAKGNPRLVRNEGDRVDANDWSLGVYGRYNFAAGYSMRLWAGYGWQDYDLSRTVLGSYGLSSSYSGRSMTAAVEVVNERSLKAGLTLSPVLGLGYKKVRQDAFREAGDDIIGLSFDSADYSASELYLGLSLKQELKGGEIYAKALYKRRLSGGAPELTARFNGGGSSFNLSGEEEAYNKAVLGAGYQRYLTKDKKQRLSLGYELEMGDGRTSSRYNVGYEIGF